MIDYHVIEHVIFENHAFELGSVFNNLTLAVLKGNSIITLENHRHQTV